MFSTETAALTLIPAEPPTAAPAEMDRISSIELASTVTLPSDGGAQAGAGDGWLAGSKTGA